MAGQALASPSPTTGEAQQACTWHMAGNALPVRCDVGDGTVALQVVLCLAATQSQRAVECVPVS
jgi:hypothetical protein